MVHRLQPEKVAAVVNDGCAKLTLSDIEKIVQHKADITALGAGPLKSIQAKIDLLYDLTADVFTRAYREIPIATAVMVAFSLKYMLDPLDAMIIDSAPGIDISDDPGPYQDDIAVITHVVRAAHGDIARYAVWKKRDFA